MATLATLTRRKFTRFASAGIFAAGALLVSLAQGDASAGTNLSTGTGSGSTGATFTTTTSVSLAGTDELNGFDVTLVYDPAVAVPTAVTIADVWTFPLASDFGGTTIHVAGSRLGFCTGNCPLFTVTWSSTAPGSFALAPSAYTLAGREAGVAGDLTQATFTSGPVTVTGSQQPAATATNTTAAATNTPVPPTATSTAVAASTSTPAVPATATPTAAPSSASATNTPVAAASPIPAVIATPSPAGGVGSNSLPGTVSTPSAAAPSLPTAQATVVAGVRTGTGSTAGGPPAGQVIPLPPRTGESQGGVDNPALRGLGILLMVTSGTVFLAGFAGTRLRFRRFTRAVDTYLDDVEHDARKRK